VTLSPDFIEAIGTVQSKAVQADIRRWAKAWSIPSLERSVAVRVNRRLRTSIARYIRDESCIEVGPTFLKSAGIRREALAHELAHAAVTIRFGRTTRIHGVEWRLLVETAGFAPRTRINATNASHISRNEQTLARYEHRCPVCHMKRLSRRPVHAWRCKQCVEAGLTGQLQIRRI
jgi:predicted SprT family Zn-dependent metalloprotease